MTRKVCVFTGTRAEYGLLYWLMREIQNSPELKLQLLVSGSHLASEFGETWKQIEADGFTIDEKVDMHLESDAPVAVAQSMALGLAGCAEALDRLKPAIMVVLGDRYEALAAAEAAMVLGLPIAHIHGGEASEGVMDDAIRHAITKLAHLHFPAAEPYRAKIVQLGEDPDRVFNVGAPALDQIARASLLDRAALGRDIGFDLGERFFVVTFHPAALDAASSDVALRALFDALDRFPDHRILFTKANADPDGRHINRLIEDYAARQKDRVHAVASLGSRRYLSAVATCDAVIGNSSSGLIEAPALGQPTVNIGDRQKGRLRAPSVIDCRPETDEIVKSISRALSREFQDTAARRESPYGSAGASKRICEVLAAHPLNGLTRKTFWHLH
jgi:UDP-hydrolysing UDP-N-acetyl-D-glucosamine 2-epimerase